MLDELIGIVSSATGAEGGMAVVLVALVAYMKAKMAAEYSADDVALKYLERNADRNLDELARVQDRYVEVLEKAAVLQGQLTALEREHAAMRALFGEIEKATGPIPFADDDTDEVT